MKFDHMDISMNLLYQVLKKSVTNNPSDWNLLLTGTFLRLASFVFLYLSSFKTSWLNDKLNFNNEVCFQPYSLILYMQ